MSSAAPSRKPYRKAPPQHREARHALAAAAVPTTPPQTQAPDDCQVKAQTFRPPPLQPSPLAYKRQRDLSSLSSLEFGTPPATEPFRGRRGTAGGRQAERRRAAAGVPPKSILKKGASPPAAARARRDVIGKSESAESAEASARRPSAGPPSGHSAWRTGLLEEKVRFSNFLDEITCRVISPAHLTLFGREASRRRPGRPGKPTADADRRRRWDAWVAALRRSVTEGAGHVAQVPRPNGGGQGALAVTQRDVGARVKPLGWTSATLQPFFPFSHRLLAEGLAEVGVASAGKQEEAFNPNPSGPLVALVPMVTRVDARQFFKKHLEQKGSLPQEIMEEEKTPERVVNRVPAAHKEVLSDSERIRILQRQNEDLRRRLSLSSHKVEAMEAEFDGSRHYMEAELSRTRDDLDKMRDKFRRLQNSYTASQRTNQDLEEKLHALLRTVERDKKRMDGEMVELTNKLLEAKNAIDRLEELNERYRLDCNLAVRLLKCNKSHFRNHKFADLPCELQDMLKKQMKSSSLPEPSHASSGGQDPDTLSLTPSDVVPTSVIARVLEKPEPLLLNSAQSSSRGWPAAEDVFVHVDMTAEGRGALAGAAEDAAPVDGPWRGPDGGEEAGAAPSFDKLDPYPPPPPPNPLCPGRKVIEFSSDDKVKVPKNGPLPNCTYATRQAISLGLHGEQPASPSHAALQHHDDGGAADTPSSQSSPFSSPPQAASMGASSASSSEDLLANWQRLFVDKMAPSAAAGGASSRAAYSDGEEGSTASHASSLDTDTDAAAAGGELLPTDARRPEDGEDEEPRRLPVISPRLLDLDPAFAAAALPRPHRSPKRMGVHHLHRQQQ
ncbi:tight junction-associated protein 1 isoform X2 [Festucalex cinctus]